MRLAASPPHGEHWLEPIFNHHWRACLSIIELFCHSGQSQRGRVVSPWCHLFYVSHLRFAGEPHTVGCLPMCCPLIHCMTVLLRRCLMPGGLLGAISGILAGGILGFGAAEWIVLLTPSHDLAPCFCVLFLFLSKIHNSASSAATLELTGHGLSPVVVVWVVVCFGWFLFLPSGLLLWFLSFDWPDMTSDCVKVRAPLLTPQGGTLKMHLDNSFISTTLCDDLARATEAQDAPKVVWLSNLSQNCQNCLNGPKTAKFAKNAENA